LPVAGIAARKGLPGEIVISHGKIAGEPFEAAAQDLRHALVARQRIELRRRNAQPEQRGGLVGQPAHEALVEDGGQFGLEHRALGFERGRGEDARKVDPVEPREQVRHADEIAQQPALVDPAREPADAPPPDQVAPFPIAARRFVEQGASVAR
jgi:hypothetical protein